MFEVEAFDDIDKIGNGRHERFTIDGREFKDKFELKRNKLGCEVFTMCKSIKEA